MCSEFLGGAPCEPVAHWPKENYFIINMLHGADPSEYYYPIIATVNGGLGLASGLASLLHVLFSGNSEALLSLLGAGIWASLAILVSALAAKLNIHSEKRRSLVMFDAIMTSVSFILSLVSFPSNDNYIIIPHFRY